MHADYAIERAREIIALAAKNAPKRPAIRSFFDQMTASVSHVLHDPVTRSAIIVDPVLDYDSASGRTALHGVDAILAYIEQERLAVAWILETHIHADHLSAAAALRRTLGVGIAASQYVLDVQDRFADLFDMDRLSNGANPFDRLFHDGDTFEVGQIECLALHVPGHTPADMAYVIGDVVLTGDTVFMPDFGTARADFPGGDAAQLYRSVRRLLALPDETRLLHCHDYPPPSRAIPAWSSTVADQRADNIHMRDGITEVDFVAMRTARDATLAMPTLMLASVQVNICGGELPTPAANGRRYLKMPLDAL